MSESSTLTNEKPQVEVSAPPQAKRLISPTYVYIGIVALVVALAVIVALVVLAVNNPTHTETFRDIAIIALAAESGLIGLTLLVLIVQVARLTNMLEFEIKPILQNTSDTISTVRGTATFMSEHIVSPMIKASSYASGAARLAGAFGNLFDVGRKKRPEKSQAEVEPQSTEGGQ